MEKRRKEHWATLEEAKADCLQFAYVDRESYAVYAIVRTYETDGDRFGVVPLQTAKEYFPGRIIWDTLGE